MVNSCVGVVGTLEPAGFVGVVGVVGVVGIAGADLVGCDKGKSFAGSIGGKDGVDAAGFGVVNFGGLSINSFNFLLQLAFLLTEASFILFKLSISLCNFTPSVAKELMYSSLTFLSVLVLTSFTSIPKTSNAKYFAKDFVFVTNKSFAATKNERT